MKKVHKRIFLISVSILAMILVLVLVFDVLFHAIMKYNSYRYYEKDGQFYLRYDPLYHFYYENEYDQPLLSFYVDFYKKRITNNSAGICEETPYIVFDSIEEMKTDILSKNFTDKEFNALEKFVSLTCRKDVLFPEFTIPLFNLSDLYEPIYPDTYTVTDIHWSFSNYSFALESPETQEQMAQSATFRPLEQSSHETGVGKLLERIKQNQYASIVEKSDFTEYYFDDQVGEDIIYQFTKNGTTYTIHENYLRSGKSNYSSTIRIYGESQGQYFFVRISYISERNPERPAIEFLSQFGIQKYEG